MKRAEEIQKSRNKKIRNKKVKEARARKDVSEVESQ